MEEQKRVLTPIKDMKIGQVGYVVPWAVYRFPNMLGSTSLAVRGTYDAADQPFGSFEMRIEMRNGSVVAVDMTHFDYSRLSSPSVLKQDWHWLPAIEMREAQRTTNLAQLEGGAPYTWGIIQHIHKIGPYAVVESKDWMSDSYNNRVAGVTSSTETSFHCYVDGKSLGHSFGNLEGALANCMAYKFDPAGANSQAAYYFLKMIERDAKE